MSETLKNKLFSNRDNLWTNNGLKILTITHMPELGKRPFGLTIEGQSSIYRADDRGLIYSPDEVYLDYWIEIRVPLIQLNWNQLPADTMIAVQDLDGRIYIRKLHVISGEFVITINPATCEQELWRYAKIINQPSILAMPLTLTPGLNVDLMVNGKVIGAASQFIADRNLDASSVFIKGVCSGYSPYFSTPFKQTIVGSDMQPRLRVISSSQLA